MKQAHSDKDKCRQDAADISETQPTHLDRVELKMVQDYRVESALQNEGVRDPQRDLAKALAESRAREREFSALLKGARAILEQDDFNTTARKVFDICTDIVGATSGYVALLSDTGEENEVLFLESGGLPCSVDPDLPMPIRGLRAEAYRECKVVYDNDFMHSTWAELMPAGHVALRNVMFAPLVLQGRTVGIIGLANKNGDFDENDARVAAGFGELAAIALQKGRTIDARNQAEHQRETLIAELREALATVKQLSGLLPICSICKQVRDDTGYWKQIESYIQDHSEAEFSHSICPVCAKMHYPDLEIYKEE